MGVSIEQTTEAVRHLLRRAEPDAQTSEDVRRLTVELYAVENALRFLRAMSEEQYKSLGAEEVQQADAVILQCGEACRQFAINPTPSQVQPLSAQLRQWQETLNSIASAASQASSWQATHRKAGTTMAATSDTDGVPTTAATDTLKRRDDAVLPDQQTANTDHTRAPVVNHFGAHNAGMQLMANYGSISGLIFGSPVQK